MDALLSDDARDRTAGINALTVLAAADELRADLLAHAVPVRAPAQRLACSFRDARSALGAHRTWPLLAATLPILLATNPTPGLPNLLAVAAECARRSGAQGPLPGLAALTYRAGSGRLFREARALTIALSNHARPESSDHR
jgi:hypothetical protein